MQRDSSLKYTYDYVEYDSVKRLVAKSQAESISKWNSNYKFPPVTFFQNASEIVYQTNKSSIKGWQLLLSAEGKVLGTKGFFGQLFFNPQRRQLLLVFKGTTLTSIGNLISDIINVFLNQGGGEVNSAFTFAERVRRLISKFKQKPQIFITGHSLGGFLAQIATYTIRNCYYLDEDGKARKLLKPSEAEFGLNTFVFDAPAAFRQILRIAKAIEDPLTERCINLPINNYIVDANLINCNSKIGPHVGLIIKLKKKQHLSTPTRWQRLKNISVHGINNFKDVGDLENAKRILHLPSAEAEDFDVRHIPMVNFTIEEQEALHRIPFLILVDTPLNCFLSKYAFVKKSIKLFDEGVLPECFIPKVRFYVSQNNHKIINSAQLVENENASTMSDLMKALSNEVEDLDFELNELIVKQISSLPSGSRIGGLETDQSQQLFARLLCNSTPDYYCVEFSNFMKQDKTRREKWLTLFKGTLVLILAERKDMDFVALQRTRILYVENNTTIGEVIQVPLKICDLNEKSQSKFRNHKLNFFGNDVKAEKIFLDDIINVNLCDMIHTSFTANKDEKLDTFYFSQAICSDSENQFKDADSMAKNLQENVTLISSSAGMGKSTSLKRIAKSLRQHYPNFWTVLVDWTQIQFTIPNERKLLVQKAGALSFVRDFCIKDGDTNSVMLKRVFDLKASVKEVFVLLDSFDEACPLHRKSAWTLMQLLKASGVKMVVATRPQEENEIRKSLQCQRKNVLRLQPLSSSAQTKFLVEFLAFQSLDLTADNFRSL